MSAQVSRSRSRPFPLEPQLQVVVGHLIWAPGTELRSSLRVSCALNHRALSLAHEYYIFYFLLCSQVVWFFFLAFFRPLEILPLRHPCYITSANPIFSRTSFLKRITCIDGFELSCLDWHSEGTGLGLRLCIFFSSNSQGIPVLQGHRLIHRMRSTTLEEMILLTLLHLAFS